MKLNKKIFEGVPAKGWVLLILLAIFIVLLIIVSIITGEWKEMLGVFLIFLLPTAGMYVYYWKSKR